MQRYFAKVIDNKVLLDDGDVHHLLHVMRFSIGNKIEIVDDGHLYLGEISSTNPLNINIIKNIESNTELNKKVTLFFCLAKGDKIDFVIQKATELGASRVVLINSKRSIVKFDSKDVNKKIERFTKIAKEASEQCHRLTIPEIIGPINLNSIKDYMCDCNYLAYEADAGYTYNSFKEITNDNIKSISIIIGPEGGFDCDEIKLLDSLNFIHTSLGKRILRTETAAVYALSVISYKLEGVM